MKAVVIKGRKSGGVAIIVDNNIVSSYDNNFKYYPNGLMEALVVNLNYNGVNSNVCLLYNLVKNVSVEELNFYISGLGKSFFLLGDFNAHHNSWEDLTPW